MHERLVDLGEPLVASSEAAEVVEPREGPLDDPAALAEPRSMSALAARDERLYPPAPELAAVLVVVIAAVGEQLVRALARTAGLAAQRAEPVDERQQLGDVVAVAAGERDRQGDAVGVDQQVVL